MLLFVFLAGKICVTEDSAWWQHTTHFGASLQPLAFFTAVKFRSGGAVVQLTQCCCSTVGNNNNSLPTTT